MQAVKWASKREIYTMISDGNFIPYNPSVIDLIFAMKDNDGCHFESREDR